VALVLEDHLGDVGFPQRLAALVVKRHEQSAPCGVVGDALFDEGCGADARVVVLLADGHERAYVAKVDGGIAAGPVVVVDAAAKAQPVAVLAGRWLCIRYLRDGFEAREAWRVSVCIERVLVGCVDGRRQSGPKEKSVHNVATS